MKEKCAKAYVTDAIFSVCLADQYLAEMTIFSWY